MFEQPMYNSARYLCDTKQESVLSNQTLKHVH